MSLQTTDTVLMIRPKNFGYNDQTAESNAFQKNDESKNEKEINQKAQEEFDGFVSILKKEGIDVQVIEDSNEPKKTDAVFPNNWISFHSDGSVITYPMMAASRRAERREDIIEQIAINFQLKKRYSFEVYEEESMFLEGTGSMILDRVNKIVYACLSPRTDIQLLDKFAVLKSYRQLSFRANDANGKDIYHTNVMMALGESFCVICLESLSIPEEKGEVVRALNATGKDIIEIDFEQMNRFAGNMLALITKDNRSILVMSQQAFNSLNQDQIVKLEEHCKIVTANIETIEKYGGGSVRCMMAEIFLPRLD